MRTFQSFRIGDWSLIAVLLAAIGAGLVFHRRPSAAESTVVIRFSQETVYRLPISKKRSLAVNGPLGKTWIRVDSGAVFIRQAPCPNRTCMRMGPIRRPGQVLICIPNRVLVQIVGGDGPGVDGVTG